MASSFQSFRFLITLLFVSIIIFFLLMIVKNRQNTQQISTNSLNLRLSTLSIGKRSAIQEENSNTSKFHITNANDDLDSVITHKRKNAMTIDDWQEEDENDFQEKLKKAKQIVDSHQ